jgi:putative sigma-54 modulation protein
MEIDLTGRHVEITDALRSHIEKKLKKLESRDEVINVRVVLSVEKYRQFAEITISGRNNAKFHSHEATDDMYASVDKAIEKVERQIKRHTSKKRSAKRRKESATGAPEESSEEEPSEPREPIESHGNYRVSVSNGFPPKPMSVEEALMQLESSDGEFQAFVNEETDEVNVVYRQKEGGYGLLRRSF